MEKTLAGRCPRPGAFLFCAKSDIMVFTMKNSRNKKISTAIEFEREEDGRWIAEIPKLPGVMAYGKTKKEALDRVYAIAFRTLADIIEQGKKPAVASRLLEHAMASR